MKRMTQKSENQGIYLIEESLIKKNENGYLGEAVQRLAKFENLYEQLEARQKVTGIELEKLKAEGKIKSTKFKQLMVNKINGSNMLQYFDVSANEDLK